MARSRQEISLKQLAIDKDNAAIVIAVGIASFVIIFSLVACNALIKQERYQSKVIGKKKETLKVLKTNAEEVKKLETSYQAFASTPQNVLGGSSTGTGDRDGENPRLVLDALPSKYDFPGLTSSLNKLFQQYQLESITGTDDEVAQAAAQSSSQPQPIEMPFTVVVNGTAQNSKEILEKMEKSIRPMQVKTLTLNGQSDQLKISVSAHTYFQPQKKFEVRSEQIK